MLCYPPPRGAFSPPCPRGSRGGRGLGGRGLGARGAGLLGPIYCVVGGPDPNSATANHSANSCCVSQALNAKVDQGQSRSASNVDAATYDSGLSSFQR